MQAIKDQWEPQTIESFVEKQLARARSVRDVLSHEWHARVVGILSDAANPESASTSQSVMLATCSQDALKALFDAVAVLMAIQLRSLVTRSLQRLEEFFQRLDANEAHTTKHGALYGCPETQGLTSAFLNRMATDSSETKVVRRDGNRRIRGNLYEPHGSHRAERRRVEPRLFR